MDLVRLSVGFGLFLMVTSSLLCDCYAFAPADNYLIDCGSSTNTTVGNRIFLADLSSSSTLETPKTILANTTANSVSSFDSSPLYQTARIFTGPSSYSFPILKQGRHFIRLYFYPFVYQAYDLTSAIFTVSTQQFILLTNYRTSNSSAAVFKEYSLNITTDTLTLYFLPSESSFLAFVNAIEVLSVPDDLIADTAQSLSPTGTYSGLSDQVLETIYRINMGGPKVFPVQDTLWRTWITDKSFLINKSPAKFFNFVGPINYVQGGATKETAPVLVYSTATELAMSDTSLESFNVTWKFSVDTSSPFMIRMHFCDIVSKALNQLYFNVYINGLLGIKDLDLSTLMLNTLAAPYYADFIVRVADGSGKIHISIGPSSLGNVLPDGILNGLEIMRINTSANRFNGQISTIPNKGLKKKLGVILGSVIGVFLIVILVVFLCMVLRRQRKMLKKGGSKFWLPLSKYKGNIQSSASKFYPNGSSAPSGQNAFGFQFPFVVLQGATNNFDENRVIGVGGFGKVYKGVLKDDTKVAVKRGNSKSQQGIHEFHTEIELLSRLRHRHLVSLIGHCDENDEMILVYDFMEKGTLKSHLYGSGLPSLSWKQRLEICIGSAKGLHYLHTGSAKAIIHRDVKSANILLDENLLAKVADFGLSKTGPDLDQTHVSTAVKGSFGYLDPEYYRKQQLTEKSDVYSFGVVLLEVLCARPVIDPTLRREMVNLAEWAMKCLNKGQLEQIIDPHLAGTFMSDSLKKFVQTAEKCLMDYGADRPSMGDVLWSLEYALQLEEAITSTLKLDSVDSNSHLSSEVQESNELKNGSVEPLPNVVEVRKDLSDVTMSSVFSQLMKPEGR